MLDSKENDLKTLWEICTIITALIKVDVKCAITIHLWSHNWQTEGRTKTTHYIPAFG